MHIHLTSYREERSSLMIFTISAVAPFLTGLQLMTSALIRFLPPCVEIKDYPVSMYYIIMQRKNLTFLYTGSSFLKITETCVISLASSGYSFSKCMPIDSAVLYDPTFVYLQYEYKAG